MSITKKIFSNTLWQIVGKFIVALLGIVSIKAITSYLSTTLNGQYVAMFDYISFFAIAADFGLYTIGIREMAKKEQDVDFILSNIISLRLVLMLSTLTVGGIAVNFIPKYANTVIPQAIWLVIIMTAFTMITGTLSSVLQYKLKMYAANLSQIIGKLIAVVYMLLVVFYFYPTQPQTGFTHLLYAGIIGALLTAIITYIYVRRETQIRFSLNRPYLKYLLKESAPYGISLVLSTIYFRIDSILLTFIRGYHETAIYSVPLKLMEILSVIPVFFMNSLLPTLTSYIQENRAKAAQTVANGFRLLFTLALPLSIGGAILAFPLTFLLSSPQYLSGFHCANNATLVAQTASEAAILCENITLNPQFALTETTTVDTADTGSTFTFMFGSDIALKLIVIAVFFSYLNTIFNFSLVALNKQQKLIFINLSGVIFNIGANLIVIPEYGFRGAAVTTILSEILILFGSYYYFNKELGFKFPTRSIILTSIAGIIMGVVIHLLNNPTYKLFENWNVAILIPFGALIYGLTIQFTKAMTLKELKTFLSPED